MTHLNQAFTILCFGKKFFTLEGLALAIISAPGSITMTKLFDALIEDVPLKDIMLPLLIAFTLILFYNIVFGFDFWSGLKAAKKEAKGKKYFISGKAYSSMFKYFVVISIIFMLSILAILTGIANVPYVPTFFIVSSGIIGLMASFFEIKSIGENIEKMNKKQYPFFEFVDGLMVIFKDGVRSKLRGFFKLPPRE